MYMYGVKIYRTLRFALVILKSSLKGLKKISNHATMFLCLLPDTSLSFNRLHNSESFLMFAHSCVCSSISLSPDSRLINNNGLLNEYHVRVSMWSAR